MSELFRSLSVGGVCLGLGVGGVWLGLGVGGVWLGLGVGGAWVGCVGGVWVLVLSEIEYFGFSMLHACVPGMF